MECVSLANPPELFAPGDPNAQPLTYGAAAEIWVIHHGLPNTVGYIKLISKVIRVDSKDFQSRCNRGQAAELWETFLQQYHRQVSSWSQLSHNNVVKVLALKPGLDLRVEYCENRSVREYLTNHHGVNKAQMIYDILSGLQYLHTRGPAVVHGNLNAGKLFVDANGTTKIGEFGLAKFCTKFAGSVPTVSSDGLRRWMSPELLDPYQDGVTATLMSDVWALGCTVFEVVAEKLPYSNYRHEMKIQKEILAGTPPGTYEDVLESPSLNMYALWGLLEDCWTEEPEDRPSVPSLLVRFATTASRAAKSHEASIPTQQRAWTESTQTIGDSITTSFNDPDYDAPLAPKQDLSTNSSDINNEAQIKNLDDLEPQKIQTLSEADDLEQAPASQGYPDISTQLTSLSLSHRNHFEQLGGVADLDKPIEYMDQAVTPTSQSRPETSMPLNDLGNRYRLQFEHLGDLASIDRAIEYQSRAVLLTPEGHPDKPSMIRNLGNSHQCRFEHFGKLEDIERAIAYQSQALLLTPEDCADKPMMLNNLGKSHTHRFNRLGDLADIERAITYQSQAVLLTTEGHPDMPGWISNYGTLLQCRFERLGELEDLSRAIECQTQAIKFTPEGHPNMPGWLNNLGNSYLCRFQRLGELEDISRAIECQSQAVLLIPAGHPDMPSLLSNLGDSCRYRFQLLGELENIGQAIEYQIQAIQLTLKGHPDMPSRFNNLANSYLYRFQRLGVLEDVNNAIDYLTQAVQLTPEGHPDLPSLFSNLGESYLCRYERLGQLEDINDAIARLMQAVQFTLEGHSDMPIQLSNLGNSYLCRYERLGELEDINMSVKLFARAISLTPDVHAELPTMLNSLGNQYQMRFRYLKKTEDNESAIEAYTRALVLLPQTHVQTSVIQKALGMSYIIRRTYSENSQDVATALDYLEAAAHSSTGLPIDRFEASREQAKLFSMFGPSASLPAHRLSMQLLQEVIWLGTARSRRYEHIAEVGAVAADAAVAAISANEYALALEWLEEGRSIIWDQTLQLQTPVDALAMVDPALAHDLVQVSRNLERASGRASRLSHFGANAMTSEQATTHHHRLVAQYNNLISQARTLPSFQGFMRPKKVADLMSAARSGPIVVVNVHAERCDALVLRPMCDDVGHFLLPDLFYKDVADFQREMHQLLKSQSLKQRSLHRRFTGSIDYFEHTLTALWNSLVKPVLDYLGYTDQLPIDQLPHITWCTTGALSFLPIHAAGNYSSGEGRIYDYAITSYTPTVSALLPSASHSISDASGVLAVSLESTVGLSPLPGTKYELAAIREHVEGLPHMQLEGSQATPQAVLDAMEKYECVHLACHSSQNFDAPAKSCFHLHGGTLSLEQIVQRSLKNKGLAFLSACQTATGDEKMPDEAIHLAAGMLVAGYPSVIATMWSITDIDAPLVADQVYHQLVDDGKLDCSRTAKALHIAGRALREKVGEKEFTRWVPYVHIGA